MLKQKYILTNAAAYSKYAFLDDTQALQMRPKTVPAGIDTHTLADAWGVPEGEFWTT